MNDCIRVEHIQKRYGSLLAVEDVSFNVSCGEIFGILGQNGAGKTTTVECIQGLRQADAGRIDVLGLNPATQAHVLRKRIGCQLQESALPDRIKVWEALSMFASMSPTKPDWRRLMADWGLSEKAKSSFATLSGGQRQRLFVALALVNNPEVVFLDEMTTGLDPSARHLAWQLIREIRAKGTTVVLVTHFMDEAEELCDRIAIVEQGRVVALDSPQALITRYAEDVCLKFTTDIPDLGWLQELEYVDIIERAGPRVAVYGRGPVLALVAAKLVEKGIIPVDLRLEQPTLEDVFLKLTGHASGLD